MESEYTSFFSNQSKIPKDKLTKDANAKSVLKYRCVLARLLKYAIPDFYSESIEDIESWIVADENDSSIALIRNLASSHTDMATIEFDLRTDAKLPGGCNVIINVEPQNKLNPSRNGETYSLAKRGVFYLSRLISEQQENGKARYENLAKCYSIWIVFNSEGNESQVIDYVFKNQGDSTVLSSKYDKDVDLMELVFLILNEKDNNSRDIFGLLNGLFTNPSLLPKYIPRSVDTQKIYEEVSTVCDIGEVRYEQGIEEGIEKGIEQGIEKGIKTLIETLQELNTPTTIIISKLMSKYNLTESQAKSYLAKSSNL